MSTAAPAKAQFSGLTSASLARNIESTEYFQ
jgi:hypothetical protein